MLNYAKILHIMRDINDIYLLADPFDWDMFFYILHYHILSHHVYT